MAEVVTAPLKKPHTHPKSEQERLTAQADPLGQDQAKPKEEERERVALSKLVDYAIECARESNFHDARIALMEARETLKRDQAAPHRPRPMFRSRLAKGS